MRQTPPKVMLDHFEPTKRLSVMRVGAGCINLKSSHRCVTCKPAVDVSPNEQPLAVNKSSAAMWLLIFPTSSKLFFFHSEDTKKYHLFN